MFWVLRAKSLAFVAVLLLLAVAFSLILPDQKLSPVTTKPTPAMVRYVEGYDRGPQVSARAAILIDVASGAVLFAKNEHNLRAPASTTKIMTAILALELGDLRAPVTVGWRPPLVPGSSIYLREGERLTLEGLLRGLMMESGNDAAATIAEHIAGSEPEFVRLMNSRARNLGAWATIFANPHGLDPYDRDHLTTAFDLALIARRGLQIPKFRELVRTRSASVESLPAMTRALRNTNRLLWYFGGADGVKTGTTDYAGNCLVASATRDGWQLLAVVLGSQDRWRDAAVLLEAGYKDFAPMLAAPRGYPVGTARVRWGMRREVPVAPARDVTVIVRNDAWSRVSATAEVKTLSAPVAPGEPAGRYRLFQDDYELTSVELVTATGTPRRTLWRTICAGALALWAFIGGGEH